MKEYVIVFAFSKTTIQEQEVLLVQKDRPAWQKGKLNLPGGKIEDFDGKRPHFADSLTVEEAVEKYEAQIWNARYVGSYIWRAAVRELEEESGLKALNCIQYTGKIIAGESLVHCVMCKVDRNQSIIPRAGETEVVSWHKWHEVKFDNRLIPNLRVVIPLCMSSTEDWSIRDNESSDYRTAHHIKVQIPTYQRLKNDTE
jgi:8-oxo-dGTP pyrophosphatase MutT (NUDIX family)